MSGLHYARTTSHADSAPWTRPQIQAEKSPFLTERLRVWMLPTLALVRLGKTVDYVVGFADLGGADDFPTSALAARCGGFKYGVGNPNPERALPCQACSLRSRTCHPDHVGRKASSAALSQHAGSQGLVLQL